MGLARAASSGSKKGQQPALFTALIMWTGRDVPRLLLLPDPGLQEPAGLGGHKLGDQKGERGWAPGEGFIPPEREEGVELEEVCSPCI